MAGEEAFGVSIHPHPLRRLVKVAPSGSDLAYTCVGALARKPNHKNCHPLIRTSLAADSSFHLSLNFELPSSRDALHILTRGLAESAVFDLI